MCDSDNGPHDSGETHWLTSTVLYAVKSVRNSPISCCYFVCSGSSHCQACKCSLLRYRDSVETKRQARVMSVTEYYLCSLSGISFKL
jgi:hypothetical protein